MQPRRRLENNSVKKLGELSPSVEMRKEEVEDDSGDTDAYTGVLIARSFTLVFVVTLLACFFLQGVVTRVHTYIKKKNVHTYIHTHIYTLRRKILIVEFQCVLTMYFVFKQHLMLKCFKKCVLTSVRLWTLDHNH